MIYVSCLDNLELLHIFISYFYLYGTINNSIQIKAKDLVIKAQVLSGGRGLGTFDNGFKGGVHIIDSAEKAEEYASQMLGQNLVTKQNPKGILCNRVYLMEKMDIKKEMYLSLLMDRASGGPVVSFYRRVFVKSCVPLFVLPVKYNFLSTFPQSWKYADGRKSTRWYIDRRCCKDKSRTYL